MFEKIRKKEKVEERRKTKLESPQLHQGVAKDQDQGVANHETLQKSSITLKINSGKSVNSVKINSKMKNTSKSYRSTPKVGKGAKQGEKETNFHDIRKIF